jgi:hypothetical protein
MATGEKIMAPLNQLHALAVALQNIRFGSNIETERQQVYSEFSPSRRIEDPKRNMK